MDRLRSKLRFLVEVNADALDIAGCLFDRRAAESLISVRSLVERGAATGDLECTYSIPPAESSEYEVGVRGSTLDPRIQPELQSVGSRCSLLARFYRETDPEHRSAGFRFGDDRPTVFVCDDSPNGVQSQPGAQSLWLGCEERLEDAF